MYDTMFTAEQRLKTVTDPCSDGGVEDEAEVEAEVVEHRLELAGARADAVHQRALEARPRTHPPARTTTLLNSMSTGLMEHME